MVPRLIPRFLLFAIRRTPVTGGYYPSPVSDGLNAYRVVLGDATLPPKFHLGRESTLTEHSLAEAQPRREMPVNPGRQAATSEAIRGAAIPAVR